MILGPTKTARMAGGEGRRSHPLEKCAQNDACPPGTSCAVAHGASVDAPQRA